MQFSLKITKDETKKGQQFIFPRCCSYEASQPGKKDELRKVASRHSSENSKPVIHDLNISRWNVTREFECLIIFLIELLAQNPYVCHAFQFKFCPVSKNLFLSLTSSLSRLPKRFSIETQQIISSQYLSLPS